MAQWYAQVGGRQYGPTSEDELRGWLAQGRVKPTDFIWSEGMAVWVLAGSVFATAGATTPPEYNPGLGIPAPLPPGMPADQWPPQQIAYLQPHRGVAVLTVGIIALAGTAVCGLVPLIMGPIAWNMGSNDLKAMRDGTMDPSGQGNTSAGRICGMIATLLCALGVALFAVYIVVIAYTKGH